MYEEKEVSLGKITIITMARNDMTQQRPEKGSIKGSLPEKQGNNHVLETVYRQKKRFAW